MPQPQQQPTQYTVDYLLSLSDQEEKQLLHYLFHHANANQCLEAAEAYIQCYIDEGDDEESRVDQEALATAQELIKRAKELIHATLAAIS